MAARLVVTTKSGLSTDQDSKWRSQWKTCPKPNNACGGTAIPIYYGDPPADIEQAQKAGLLWIGGCVIPPDRPSHYCTKCKTECFPQKSSK